MINIKEAYNKFVIKLQESFLTLGSKIRIQLMLHCIDIRPNDVLLDVGGNTGKITEFYARIWCSNLAFIHLFDFFR